MNLVAILSILQGIVSSVPEAVALFQKIAPMLDLKEKIPPHIMQEVAALAPAATDAVGVAHSALATLIASHAPPAA